MSDQRPHDERRSSGLADPRALDILSTEHWSLLSTRTLGYQEMFGRTTIFVAILSGSIVALALVAQATRFSRVTLWFVLAVVLVTLFLGLATFVRCVAINLEDARWVTGMNLLRSAYLEIVPELGPYFVTGHVPTADLHALAHGADQRPANLASSLTTTSSVVAVLNSVIAGVLASDVSALLRVTPGLIAAIGAGASLVSGVLHMRYAARFRRRHAVRDGPERMRRAE
jgi:hypothetical protein